METMNHTLSKGQPLQSVEWMNEKAQAAKQRGEYWVFEDWRRRYLNAQAAQRQEREEADGD